MSKKKTGAAHGAKGRKISPLRRVCGRELGLTAAGGLMLAMTPAAHALQLYNGAASGNNLRISLDITASYTGLYRVGQPSAILVSGASNPNANDGDANLRHGIVGNTFDVLPVLDIKDGTFGMHFSGEYFINTVYLQGNQNNQADTVNPIVAKNTDFASETRNSNGMNGRMLDAFMYDSWKFDGGQEFILKAGQQTLFWGQSLFSGDGISGGQAPIDTIQAQNLVNPEAQQIFLPVGQIVATYQPNSTYTFQGYYQYQWEPDTFQGVGSYFSESDVTGPGGYRLILGPGLYLNRTKDLAPESQNGQFGLSVQAQYGNYDVGLYTLRYDAKTPGLATNITVGPSGVGGTYTVIYPRDIWLYGASVSTTVGATNIAGELSLRTHDPLVGTAPPQINTSYFGNANSDPYYPVGNVVTGLANFIYGSPSLKYVPGGITLLGEVEWENVIRVTANKAQLAPGRSSQAASFNVEIEPSYFEVLPNLELQFPVSLSYNFAGNSQAQVAMNHGTGSYTMSIVATYRENWSASLNYVGYFGRPGTNPLAPQTAVLPVDRSYLSLNLQHTF